MKQLSLFPEDEPKTAVAEGPKLRLLVKGRLSKRKQRCRPAQMLYLLNGLADWIDTHAEAGEGGRQAVINYLVAYAIHTLETNYEPGDILMAELPRDC